VQKYTEAMVATSVSTKRGRKFDQVIEGARKVFMRDGYEGATVDDIAREAKVSKATLYNYFSDKRLLFAEVAALECSRQTAAHTETADLSLAPKINLPLIGHDIIDFLLSDFGHSVQRISIAESGRFPELGQKFYDSGPMLVREKISIYLRMCVERGELDIDDIELAAEQFSELCKVRIACTSSLLVRHAIDLATRDKIVQSAVEMFMARYGVAPRKAM
jgi:TetR/AcrR family transcriptional repressor of mexJK operon